MLAVLMTFLAGAALAQEGDSAIGNETPTADQAQDKTETETADETKEPEEFKIPAGYQAKKRGKYTVYCIKDATIGTRFQTERCFDEAQVREYLLALEIQKRDIDRIRSTCVTASVCSPP
jgi:hypothetical protein